MNSLRSSYRSRTTGSISIRHMVRGHARPFITSLHATNRSSGTSQPCNFKDRSSCQALAGGLQAPDSRRPLFPTPTAIPTNQVLQIARITRALGTVPTHQIRPINSGLSPTSRAQTLPVSRANPKVQARTRTGVRTLIEPRGHLSAPPALRVRQHHTGKVTAIRSSTTLEPL